MPPPPGSDASFDLSLLDAAGARIAEGVRVGALRSGVLAVASTDELIRLESFGSVATNSIFLLASITKPLVATAVMRLVEQGRILLSDPVKRFLPEFAGNGKADVRLWHLLTHTSGLDQTFATSMWHTADHREFCAAACEAPLMFEPGSHFFYCNSGWILLAELIRRITQQDDATFVENEVLWPLGMRDTSYVPADTGRMVLPQTWPWSDDLACQRWMQLHRPYAGLWSTAEDLIRFGQTFLRSGCREGYRLLGPMTIQLMTSLQTAGISGLVPPEGHRPYYSLGFFKVGPHMRSGPSPELRTSSGFGHGDSTDSYLWIEPDPGIVFVFLSHRWGSEAPPHILQALNAVLGASERRLRI